MDIGGIHGAFGLTSSALLKQRDVRERIFPRMREVQWLMLLALDDARERHRQLIVSNLCNGCYAPYTTALRHIVLLERRGLIERIPDSHDERRVSVRLTVLAGEKLRAYSDAADRLAA